MSDNLGIDFAAQSPGRDLAITIALKVIVYGLSESVIRHAMHENALRLLEPLKPPKNDPAPNADDLRKTHAEAVQYLQFIFEDVSPKPGGLRN